MDPPQPGSIVPSSPWVTSSHSSREMTLLSDPKPPDTLYSTSGWSIISSTCRKDPDGSRLKSDFSKNNAKRISRSHAFFQLRVLNTSCGCWVFGDWQLEMVHFQTSRTTVTASFHFPFSDGADPTRRRKDAESGRHQGPDECQQRARLTVLFAPLNPQAPSPAKQ